MMHEFLSVNRGELIERCRAKVAQRSAPKATADELEQGIPLFLDQLIKTLRVEQTTEPMRSRKVSGPAGGEKVESELSEIGETATRHGRELLQRGFTIEQVVHDYGDLCQAITTWHSNAIRRLRQTSSELLTAASTTESLSAVTEFNRQRDFVVADRQAHAFNERLGFFAHELRNFLNSATLALAAIRVGDVGLNGATGAVLDRSLVGLRNLIDRSLSDVRLTAGMPVQHRRFPLPTSSRKLNTPRHSKRRLRDVY
jgi:signal transduction histidine kinase